MRVLLAPDSFGDLLPAPDAARALAAGWATAAPADVLVLCPLSSDGPCAQQGDRLAGLAAQLPDVDLVVTGERVLDAVSLLGAVGGLAALAQEAAVPCVVLAGQVALGRREAAARGVDEAYALSDDVGLAASLADPGRHLQALAARVAGQWSRG